MGSPRKSPDRARAFLALRTSLGLTAKVVAELLRVNPQTVRNWELCRHRIPHAAFKLLRVLRRYELPDAAWDGWEARGGELWSPAGQRFDPMGLSWLSLTFRRAEAFQAVRDELCALRGASSVAISQGPTCPQGGGRPRQWGW